MKGLILNFIRLTAELPVGISVPVPILNLIECEYNYKWGKKIE